MTDFTYDTVLSAMMAEGVRCITLNRPHSLNAMNRALIDDVARAFEDANADPATRAIIFTGAGKAFCAGDDRREHVHPTCEEEARDLVRAIQRATDAIVLNHKPVVGAINGWAVGGGFFPEVSLNLFVTGGVSSLLPALVGLNKAREMLFFGDRYAAPDLQAMGLAWKCVPDADLMPEALSTARRLADLPPLAVRAMKRVLNATAMTDPRRAMDLETEATIAGFMDPETTRRLRDF